MKSPKAVPLAGSGNGHASGAELAYEKFLAELETIAQHDPERTRRIAYLILQRTIRFLEKLEGL